MTPVQRRFIHWILEREKAREAKELGAPYKGDPIIEQCRFCNVNREHDRVTVWIKDNVRPLIKDFALVDMLYQIYLCRVFNEPDVLEDIMVVKNPRTALKKLQSRRRAGLKILRGAYLVVPHGTSIDTEVYYMNLASRIHELSFKYDTLQGVADQLLTLPGMREFMVNQVCTDMRYQPNANEWADWESFVLAGPGTRRGLARYRAGHKPPARQPNGRIAKESGPCGAILLEIRDELQSHLPAHIWEYFSDPNNLANCFCEFDKYERARDGEASLRKYDNGNQS